MLAYANVQTAVTAPALTEIVKELEDIAGRRPVGGDELDFGKKYVTRGFPSRFETSTAMASQLEGLVRFHLPDDYLQTYLPNVNAVTGEDVLAVAKKYLKIDNLLVIIVGDRAKIAPPLRELPLGKTFYVMKFDDDFRLVPAKPLEEKSH